VRVHPLAVRALQLLVDEQQLLHIT
jgi:hypothetical protein